MPFGDWECNERKRVSFRNTEKKDGGRTNVRKEKGEGT